MPGPNPKSKRRFLPFFLNRTRLARDESYFKGNYRLEELMKLDLIDDDGKVTSNDDAVEANNHLYGIPRYISLENEDGDDSGELDKDNVQRYGVIWPTLRRMFTSLKPNWLKRKLSKDVESEMVPLQDSKEGLPTEIRIGNDEVIQWEDLEEIHLGSEISSKESLTSSVSTIFADETGSIQQYEITTLNGRTANVVQFSAGLSKTVFMNQKDEEMALKSLVLSQHCASLIWVCNEQSCIVLITESTEPSSWSVQQWFRKILSDMALTDSIMIGHPYYWHPVVRRKLKRVMKHFQKLYKTLAIRGSGDRVELWDTKYLELMRPRGLTKVRISRESQNKTKAMKRVAKSSSVVAGSGIAIAEDIVSELSLNWQTYKKVIDEYRQKCPPAVGYAFEDFMQNNSAAEVDEDGSNLGAVQTTTFINFPENIKIFEEEFEPDAVPLSKIITHGKAFYETDGKTTETSAL